MNDITRQEGRLCRDSLLYNKQWQQQGLIVEVIEQETRGAKQRASVRDLWGLWDEGRQENSLGTVRSISQVLYTNTGWSVRTCLGQAYILKQVAHTLGQVQIQEAGRLWYCAPKSCDFVDCLINR